MHVEWSVHLLGQCAYLSLLVQQLTLELLGGGLQVRDVGHLQRRVVALLPHGSDTVLEELDLCQALLVPRLTMLQAGPMDLDLLIDLGQLRLATDQLRAQNVPLAHDRVVLLRLALPLLVGFLDNLIKLLDLGPLIGDDLFRRDDLLFDFGQLVLELLLLLLDLVVVEVLLDERVVLGLDLLLELLDLVVLDLELPPHLRDLLLALDQIFRVKVAVAAHRLVKVLLLLEPRAAFDDLALEV
mmetsp:Transcript_33611/g.77643  ORF Transcript_33611/g.77643 Transcript_33611/m.77643 type:complete len:241 (-) Transcript_33611:1613-2335(-)